MKLLNSSMALTLLLIIFVAASALDMSIINYDSTHAHKSVSRTDDEVMAMYESWLVKHEKSYNALGEKEKRFEIFKDNLQFIDEHNSMENLTYKVGLNKFADLTDEEYMSSYLGAKTKPEVTKVESLRYAPRIGESLPDSVDWRAKGAVSPIKDQKVCGSCWAFATIATVEGINQIVTGDLITLSEQELLDCDYHKPRNNGCHGGYRDEAFEFIIKNGGIDSDKDYPYLAVETKKCQNKKNATIVTIDGYEKVPAMNEKALKKAVSNQPISTSIEARGRAIKLYKSGIFTGSCGTRVDHAVVVVGYGTEKGKDYWIVRNSWGTDWGEDGYMRIAQNVGYRNGKCGIAMYPIYPIKKEQHSPKPEVE